MAHSALSVGACERAVSEGHPPGLRVAIALRAASPVRKQDQRTGRRTVGVVKDILTSAPHHTRGIKVRLEDGQLGRVQEIELAEGDVG